jgi:hypothetical protein
VGTPYKWVVPLPSYACVVGASHAYVAGASHAYIIRTSRACCIDISCVSCTYDIGCKELRGGGLLG